jgi:hypothetical protein
MGLCPKDCGAAARRLPGALGASNKKALSGGLRSRELRQSLHGRDACVARVAKRATQGFERRCQPARSVLAASPGKGLFVRRSQEKRNARSRCGSSAPAAAPTDSGPARSMNRVIWRP